MEITREIAIKVRDTVAVGLSKGVGEPIPGQMCVEAAVCYALGLPHGDDPGCVAQSLRRLKICLNDMSWSSPLARANGLRRLALAQLGSAGVLDEAEFNRRVVDMTIRQIVPMALRYAARGVPSHAEALEAAAVRCETDGTREAILEGRRVALAAYLAAGAAYLAASATAYAIDADAANDTATRDAASTYATFYAATYAYVDDAHARDRALADYAERVVSILIDMKAPGCQWLDLVPVEAA